jgi:hypothetical protein
VFEYVWTGGGDPEDADRFEALRATLNPAIDSNSERSSVSCARRPTPQSRQGVFGVPTFAVDGKSFWGQDALPMLRDYLANGRWFHSGAMGENAPTSRSVVRRDLRS